MTARNRHRIIGSHDPFDDQHDHGGSQDIEPRQDVSRQSGRERDGAEPSTSLLTNTSPDKSNGDEGEREAQRVRVLTGKSRKEIAAIDRVGAVKQEDDDGPSEHDGYWSRQSQEPTHHVGAEWHHERTERRGQLEGNGGRDDKGGNRRERIGKDEVVGVHRHSRKPTWVPRRKSPGETEVLV